MNRRCTLLGLLLFLTVYSLNAQQKGYMLVLLNKKPDAVKLSAEQSKALMEGHFANMKKLALEGRLLAAGPFEGGGGLFILNTTNKDEALTWIGPDPGIQNNRWNVEILPYTPRRGSICKQDEKSEMVNYHFIRYRVLASRQNSDYEKTLQDHDAYLTEHTSADELVTDASLGEHEGGIIIVRNEPSDTFFTNDPGVLRGLIETEIKKLYIAKGSFCEQ